jgi:hypothetical protein
MSDWTLGAVKVRNMEINALCQNEACRHLFTFNLDALIEGAGADFLLPTFRRWSAWPAGSARSPSASLSSTRRARRTKREAWIGESYQRFAARG